MAVTSSLRSTYTGTFCRVIHSINNATKRPIPSLDKDSAMESKACVQEVVFSILGIASFFNLHNFTFSNSCKRQKESLFSYFTKYP